MLEPKITSWSGFTEAPIIVALDGDARPTDEPQADTRPALRLIHETPEGMKPLGLDGDVTLTARPGLKPGSQITGLSAAILA